MENNREIISDLKGLVSIINDGKEGYESAIEATENPILKQIFSKYAAQRATYADELKAHIEEHGGHAYNESGGMLGALHRTWIDIKHALSRKEDKAILNAVETGERAALERYDVTLYDYTTHKDHLSLLKRQRAGIQEAFNEIQMLLSEIKT